MAVRKINRNFAAESIIYKRKECIMEYKAVKYSNKEEALIALNKMRQRKLEWIKETQREFAELRNTPVTI